MALRTRVKQIKGHFLSSGVQTYCTQESSKIWKSNTWMETGYIKDTHVVKYFLKLEVFLQGVGPEVGMTRCYVSGWLLGNSLAQMVLACLCNK